MLGSRYPSLIDGPHKQSGWKELLARHETFLVLLLVVEVCYFAVAGRRFGTADNLANIVRHSVEIGLLAKLSAVPKRRPATAK